ncbi:MAG: RNA polymerase sigma factor [Planctomycetota bacterium]|jgi:RNA polymerase sigma-70 factor (ECF subfamily)
MLEDKLLIWKYRRGNVDALRQVYDKYKGHLLKLAIALTADISLAEDVVQDVFARLAESHDRIGMQGNLKNYLITCLINRIRTLRRDRQRREGKNPALAEQASAALQRPDQWAELNEEMQLLVSALAQLPTEQRETITLRFEAGMRFRQIARVQGASVNTTHGRYRYGMEKLRSLLDGEVM